MIIGHNSKDGTAGFYGTAPLLGLIPPDKPQRGEAAYETALEASWPSLHTNILNQYVS
jgi:hypothetical protein